MQEQGELLFTHFGLSGPLVLSAPAPICGTLTQKHYLLSIDLKPALDEQKLDAPAAAGLREVRQPGLSATSWRSLVPQADGAGAVVERHRHPGGRRRSTT